MEVLVDALDAEESTLEFVSDGFPFPAKLRLQKKTEGDVSPEHVFQAVSSEWRPPTVGAVEGRTMLYQFTENDVARYLLVCEDIPPLHHSLFFKHRLVRAGEHVYYVTHLAGVLDPTECQVSRIDNTTFSLSNPTEPNVTPCKVHFKLEEKLGNGTFGSVFAARVVLATCGTFSEDCSLLWQNPDSFAVKQTKITEAELAPRNVQKQCRTIPLVQITLTHNKYLMPRGLGDMDQMVKKMKSHLPCAADPGYTPTKKQFATFFREYVDQVYAQLVCLNSATKTPYVDIKTRNVIYFIVHRTERLSETVPVLADYGSLQPLTGNLIGPTFIPPDMATKFSFKPSDTEAVHSATTWNLGIMFVSFCDHVNSTCNAQFFSHGKIRRVMEATAREAYLKITAARLQRRTSLGFADLEQAQRLAFEYFQCRLAIRLELKRAECEGEVLATFGPGAAALLAADPAARSYPDSGTKWPPGALLPGPRVFLTHKNRKRKKPGHPVPCSQDA